MKRELNHLDDVVQGATDSELELMLADAYDVPGVPRSLLKRLDGAVEQEWGVSPRLSRREPTALSRLTSGGSRVLRAWPIAVCLAMVVVAIAVFQTNAHAYGWGKMVEALKRAELVRLESDDQTSDRWMSVTKAVLGERSDGGSRLLDFGRGIVLQHSAGDEQIQRRSFTPATGMTQQEAVVLAFLLGNVHEEGEAFRQSNLQVVSQRWSSAGQHVVLEVSLRSETDSAELRITIDPQTHLPQRCSVDTADHPTNELALSYSDTDAANLLARDFPADLTIVDAGPKADEIAAEAPRPGEEPPSRDVASGTSKTIDPAIHDPVPLVGAASLQWNAVRPGDRSSEVVVEQLDATLAALWRENNIEPAELASDEELLRRVYLDLAGRTPNVSEVRAYLSDASPDRYLDLVNRLLASRDHATHMATVWRTYLIPEGIDLARFGGPESFEEWIGKQFSDQVPYDEIVRRLLLAEGRLSQSGPLLFYAAVKMDPDQLAARSARVFLGMRLDCVQCHDDHFEPWLQEDFWGFAAFFARISRPQATLEDVSTVMRVHDIGRGEVKLPETETVVAPRFLDGSPLELDEATVARRQHLAEWLTAGDNPFFARATANRVWGQLFGKGIVNPVDGFGQQHEPVSQALLDQLAGHFIASDYNLRDLFKTIVLSRAYRLSSGATTVDPRRHELFAQMNVKLLTAEQMYDCVTVASMLVSAEAGSGFNLARVGNSRRDQFLQQFRAPPGRSTEYQAGIPQALTLMNGGLINDATGLTSSGLLTTLEVPFIKNKDRLEILYMATLSRRPTASEAELLGGYITTETSGDELYESLADVLWALLNSAEFTMNH